MNLSLCFSVLTTNSHKFCLDGNTGRPGGSDMWNIANALSLCMHSLLHPGAGDDNGGSSHGAANR